MHPMDAQRYDLAKRGLPAHEESVSDTAGARNGIHPVVHDASSIETRSPLLPAALTGVKVPPPTISQQWDASAIPLPLSPLLSPSHNGFMEGVSAIPDTPTKDSTKFPVLSDDDSKSRQVTLPPLMAPSPKVSHSFMQSMQSLFLHDDGSEGIFSRPGSPSPISPPVSPKSRPTSPRFWKRACKSPVGSDTGPLSPPFHPFDGLPSESWGPMSCPTSPLLQPPNPPPSPTSPSASRPMVFSDESRKLRALSSTSRVAPGMSSLACCPMSPLSWPTSPVVQAFNVDNWVPERDPTEGIDVIEIMVTKEISIHVEYIEEAV